jgi:hypothetical protein
MSCSGEVVVGEDPWACLNMKLMKTTTNDAVESRTAGLSRWTVAIKQDVTHGCTPSHMMPGRSYE